MSAATQTPTLNEALGRGITVEHKGRVLELAPVDHAQVVSAFEDHLRQRSLQSVDRVRAWYGPVAGDVAMRAFLDNDAEGVYEFGSKLWVGALQQAVNQRAVVLFALRAKRDNGQVTRALADEVFAAHPDAVRRLLWGDPAAADDAGGDGPNG